MTGGDNIVQQKDFAWKKVATEFFDIHYYTTDPVTARLVGKYAEEALWDATHMLDYKNRSRFSLFIFLSPNDFIQSNLYPQPNEKDGGITPIRTNTASLVFPGNYQQLQRQLKSTVSKLLIEDYYFGGNIQSSIPNALFLHLPSWFSEGLPAFIGEGWDYTDELWISSLGKSNLLDIALEDDAPINHITRKSIWYFIVSQYGPGKISEIFYMTRLTRSVEDGIVHVLGITLKTLTERWREFLLQRVYENANFRDVLEDNASRLEINPQDRLLSFSLNPVAPIAAVYLERDGKQRIVLYDLNTGELSETPIEGGFPTEQLRGFQPDMPMAWSPNGNLLLATIYKDGSEQMAYYNRSNGDLTYLSFQPRLDRIFQMDWSHDGKQIVCSGLRGGAIDLYRFTPGSNSFIQLTEDLFDDLNPVWSMDDARIYYASSRPNDTIQDEDVRFDVYRNRFDVWELNLEEKSTRQITQTPIIDEFPVAAKSSFELLLRSNETGIFNLFAKNVFVGTQIVQSNLTQGIYRVDIGDSLVAFTSPDKGALQLYVANREDFLHESVAMKSIFRLRTNKHWDLTLRSKALKERLDSLQEVTKKVEEKIAKNQNTTEKLDSAKVKKKDKVKYYVFDEEEKPRIIRRKKPRNKTGLARRKKPQKPDFNLTELKSPSASKNRWAVDRIAMQLRYDPIFKLSVALEARFKDLKGNHALTFGFQPYSDLKSSDSWVHYTNKKHRIDWFTELERSSRFLNRFDFHVRYISTRLNGGLVYPINRYLSVGGGLNLAHIDRKNLLVLVPNDIDDSDVMAGGHLNFTYDKTEKNLQFVKSGTKMTLDLRNSYAIGAGTYNFTTAQLDLRKYIPIKRTVLATRLTAGWSLGDIAQQFFMGGTSDWLFSRFSNTNDLPIESALPTYHYMQYVMPMHGFRFNARNGSKYVMANAELRIPISRMIRSSLNSNPLYSLEIIPFFDIGTTWSQGNPLSQKNPIDTETINSYPLTITVQTLKSPFIMGFGAGTRLMILGYWTRVDLGWGIDDFTVLSPRLHLSLGKNF
ncbi:MAG TPA: hypothetical protein ENJ82_12785 [Bacteroidetes bacterium]|nr:hypothetical protein [Bacteroidota bacterium]